MLFEEEEADAEREAQKNDSSDAAETAERADEGGGEKASASA